MSKMEPLNDNVLIALIAVSGTIVGSLITGLVTFWGQLKSNRQEVEDYRLARERRTDEREASWWKRVEELNANLSKEVESLRSRLADFEELLDAVEEELDSQKRATAATELERDTLAKRVENLEKENVDLVQLIGHQRETIEKMDLSIKELREENLELRRQVNGRGEI